METPVQSTVIQYNSPDCTFKKSIMIFDTVGEDLWSFFGLKLHGGVVIYLGNSLK